MKRCLGVLRELTNSPNRETDDAMVLRAVLEQLSILGVSTTLMTPEEFDCAELSSFDIVVPMCEAYPRLKRLQLEASAAPDRFVNHPDAVLNCYRTRMVALLKDCDGLVFPPSEVRNVGGKPGPRPESLPAEDGWWVKRGDVHNTCDRDVVRVRRWTDMEQVLADFRSREITQFILQPHLAGDLVKFYGVGPGRWFTWFYHDPTRALRLPFELDELARSAAAGARALGLEVFGGDAIISASGEIAVIDLNSWPSFARVRPEAAVQIAWHVKSRLGRRAAASRKP